MKGALHADQQLDQDQHFYFILFCTKLVKKEFKPKPVKDSLWCFIRNNVDIFHFSIHQINSQISFLDTN